MDTSLLLTSHLHLVYVGNCVNVIFPTFLLMVESGWKSVLDRIDATAWRLSLAGVYCELLIALNQLNIDRNFLSEGRSVLFKEERGEREENVAVAEVKQSE